MAFRVITGTLVHSIIKDQLTILENHIIVINNGKIVALEDAQNEKEVDKIWKMVQNDYIHTILKPYEFICPGFIDLHIHAPQFPNLGLGMDKPLLEWLQTYTIPLETRYKDLNFSDKIYNYVVDTTLKCGTTTACYFATIYKQSTQILAKIVENKGQRALIGKVNMNQNSIPEYVEKTEISLKDTEQFINDILDMNCALIEPIITPRFAISCDMELLKQLGFLAQKHNLYIQTHISENENEVKFTKELFPNCSGYADVYDKAGLLTNKTILAHAVFLTDEEEKLISHKGASVAHCASSNTYLKSGLCNVERLLENNVKVGLGTDVAGGISPSILDAMRATMATSIHLNVIGKQKKNIDFHQAFYLATLGGAKALGKDDIIGNFIIGKDFDALLINMKPDESISGSLKNHTMMEMVQKFIFSGDDRNIQKVFVNGKIVVPK